MLTAAIAVAAVLLAAVAICFATRNDEPKPALADREKPPPRRSGSPYPIFTADELHAIMRNDPEKTKSLLGRGIEVIGKVDHVYDDHARIWVQLWLFTESPPPKGTSENVVAIFRGPPAGGHSPAFLQKINDIKWGKETPWITVVGPFKTDGNVAIIDPAIFVAE